MSLLDDINKELGELSDAEIAEAAAKIQARQARAKAAMTPDRIAKGKEREKKRRMLNAAILRAAKEKGLVAAPAASEQSEGDSAQG